MPAGPAPTTASLSLVTWFLTTAFDDRFCEARERLLDRSGGNHGEGCNSFVGPTVRLFEGTTRDWVLAQFGDRLHELGVVARVAGCGLRPYPLVEPGGVGV